MPETTRLPEPCPRCGWQYPPDMLANAASGRVRLDPQPTHLCAPATPDPTPAPLTPDHVDTAAMRAKWDHPAIRHSYGLCVTDMLALADAHDALTTALAEARAEVEAWQRVHAEDQEIARARRDEARVAAVEAVLDRWRDDPNIRLQTTTYASIQAYLRAALTQPQGDR